MKPVEYLKKKSEHLKREIYALTLAYRHRRVTPLARIVIICVVAYALSPIDLIPDFIPVLGYIDDLLLVPLGIALALRLIPKDVLEECRKKAAESSPAVKANLIAAGVIILTWIVAGCVICKAVFDALSRR
jgi:uncharacterized membrane protein YkvA (DUF1232 family)